MIGELVQSGRKWWFPVPQSVVNAGFAGFAAFTAFFSGVGRVAVCGGSVVVVWVKNNVFDRNTKRCEGFILEFFLCS